MVKTALTIVRAVLKWRINIDRKHNQYPILKFDLLKVAMRQLVCYDIEKIQKFENFRWR